MVESRIEAKELEADYSNWGELIDPSLESQRMLSTLISNLPGMVYRCLNDKKYTMLFVSKRVKDIFGFDPEEVLNNRIYSFIDFIHPDDVDRIWDETQVKLQTRESFRLDYRIIDLHGNTKWLWEQGVGVFDNDDNLLGLEGFMIDITDKINLEKKLEKSKNLALLGEFSSAVAHQVRNPLGECLLSAKLMQTLLTTMEKDDEENSQGSNTPIVEKNMRENLKFELLNLIRGINNLNSVVTQILNYTKNMKLRFYNHKINTLLQDMVSPYKEDMSRIGIEVVFDIEQGLDQIMVDAIMICQAFQNLIDNSIRLMPNGGYIKINVNRFKESDNMVIITISDSGPGLEKKHFKKILRPFYTTRNSGTGLGLSFAKRVVESHNGKIWICDPDSCFEYFNTVCEKYKMLKEKKLSGTTFHITLPIHQEQ